MCRLKDSCVPLYNILLVLLYIKEHWNGFLLKPNFRFGKWVFPTGAGVCDVVRQVTEETTLCESRNLLLSSKMMKKEKKICNICERGRVGSLFIFATRCLPWKSKCLLTLPTWWDVAHHIPHPAQRRKSLITDSLLLGLPPSSYLNCYKIYEGEDRQPPFISVAC